MGLEDRPGVRWVSPNRRAILPLRKGSFRVPKSLAQRCRSQRFTIRCDTAFEPVLRACAAPRLIEGTTEHGSWLCPPIINLYLALHRARLAHSLEAWLPSPAGDRLVGGLYGLALGGAFFGESMFSRPLEGGTDASKVCLVALVGHLRRQRFTLLDTQLTNPHTASFGVREIPADRFLERLRRAALRDAAWGQFEPDLAFSHAHEITPSASAAHRPPKPPRIPEAS
ncbi:MAG: leucyl/phenylalanyl-tRNA--protein transferase [Phycisphaeraceae bacterium]|nr:MAG: leucyl/phenylalanyl-tRNA--protein transferase [Phycisphaeraceae bacterium]